MGIIILVVYGIIDDIRFCALRDKGNVDVCIYQNTKCIVAAEMETSTSLRTLMFYPASITSCVGAHSSNVAYQSQSSLRKSACRGWLG